LKKKKMSLINDRIIRAARAYNKKILCESAVHRARSEHDIAVRALAAKDVPAYIERTGHVPEGYVTDWAKVKKSKMEKSI